ncbi:hypothetical protein JCM11251_004578 [Rhodosporidiobolus azoricus]
MGEPGFEEATATAGDLAPTAVPAAPTVLVVTVTAQVEVAATTVTQLVQPLGTALPPPSSFPILDDSGPVFGGTSSPGVGKIVQPSLAVDAEATTPKEADPATQTISPDVPAADATTEVLQASPKPTAATSFMATTSQERVFNPKWDSQIRAVVSTSGVAASTAPTPTITVSSIISTTSERRASSRIAVAAPPSSTLRAEAVSSSSVAISSLSLDATSNSLSDILSVGSFTLPLLASSSSISLGSASASGTSVDITYPSSPTAASPSSSMSPVAVLPSSSPSASPPTSSGADRDSSAASFFSTLGKSPANIALTTIVCAGILAVLLGVLAFFLRRCHRRRKKAHFGSMLGSEAGDDTPRPAKRWTEKFANEEEPLTSQGGLGGGGGLAYLDLESPQMEEVWQRRMSSREGHGSAQYSPCDMLTLPARAATGDARRPSTSSSEWTSFGGDHAMQPRRQEEPDILAGAGGSTRKSVSVMGTSDLYPSCPSAAYSAYPAFHLPHRLATEPAPPAPAQLGTRPLLHPSLSTISASIYSTTIPPTPLSPTLYPYPSTVPLSPRLGNVSPTVTTSPSPRGAPPSSPSYFTLPRSEILAHPTTTTPGIVRTLPSLSGPSGPEMPDPSPASTPGGGTWKESLEQVMGSAAELFGPTFGITAGMTSTRLGRDEERGELRRQDGAAGDRFTTFPAAAPRRSPPTIFTTSTVRPTRPPPLILSPRPPTLIARESHLSLISTFSDSTIASPPASADHAFEHEPEPGALVSPSTLAFPEKAFVQVDERAHAAKGVLLTSEKKEKTTRPGLPRFEPRLMLLDERRTQSEPGHGGDAVDEEEKGEQYAPLAVNPFLLSSIARRPTRPRKSSQRRPSLNLLPSSLSRPPMMARQRTLSLDLVGAGGLVSPFAHADDSDADGDLHESDSLDMTSSSSSSQSHSDDSASKAASERISSLMLERRRRSLASLSAAGTVSLPGSRSASRSGSVAFGAGGSGGKKGIEADLRALFPESRA